MTEDEKLKENQVNKKTRFVAFGDQLSSDIEIEATDLDAAYQWAHEAIGWDVTILPKNEYKKEN